MQLIYKEYTPTSTLAPYLQCFWSISSNGNAYDSSPWQRCFPSGYTEWIVQVKGPTCKGFDEEGLFAYPAAMFSAVNEKAAVWAMNGQSELFGIRLSPETALTLFGKPFSNFKNSHVEATDYMGPEAGTLTGILQQASTVAERILIVENYLLKLLNKQKKKHPPYLPAALKMLRQHEKVTIKELSSKLYVCPRQLQRSFQAIMGISPMEYYRVTRLSKAHELILMGQRNFSQVAYELGYADPAHFTREFKDHFGSAPSEHFSNTAYKLAG
ncbi:MAG TPA: helix-turn-helix transcriptional regulator [Phnomibacter sp.]|nr:helix-turn-helix transcriptional regulator [Phnomibacter sp.]